MVGPEELSELRSDLEEHVSPASSGVGPKEFGLFLVHLQILGEHGLAGEDPGPAPVPPLPDRAPGRLAHGGDGLGPA